MTRALALTILLLAVTPALAAPADSAAADEPKLTGRLEARDGVQVLTLWGTPRERGFAHGYLLAPDIVRALSADLTRLLGSRARATMERIRAMAEQAFAFSPDEEAELEGILAGIRARLTAKERRNVIADREFDLMDLRILNTVGDWYMLGCSSAALWGERTRDGTATVVRNFDFPALEMLVRPALVVVRADHEKARGWVGVGHAGGLGTITAMNREGVFVSIHDVGIRPAMKDVFQSNVPRLVALRRLMEQLAAKGACENALGLLRSWPTLYGNNFMLATPVPGEGVPAAVCEYDTREDRNGGVDLRCADQVKGRRCEYVVCSNHHRVRSKGRCRRYDDLVSGCLLDGPEAGRTVKDLFGLASRAAVPRGRGTISLGRHGTIHQAVARTGEKRLWLRFVTLGDHIRAAKPIRFEVPASVKGARATEIAAPK